MFLHCKKYELSHFLFSRKLRCFFCTKRWWTRKTIGRDMGSFLYHAVDLGLLCSSALVIYHRDKCPWKFKLECYLCGLYNIWSLVLVFCFFRILDSLFFGHFLSPLFSSVFIFHQPGWWALPDRVLWTSPSLVYDMRVARVSQLNLHCVTGTKATRLDAVASLVCVTSAARVHQVFTFVEWHKDRHS